MSLRHSGFVEGVWLLAYNKFRSEYLEIQIFFLKKT